MKNSFQIIDGTVYVDKELFWEAQRQDNNISKLTGSYCTDFFKPKPTCKIGPNTVIIDFSHVDHIQIEKNPNDFVQELCNTYHYKIRGHIVINEGDTPNRDILINQY